MCQLVHVGLLPLGQVSRVARQFVLRGHGLGHGFGVGDEVVGGACRQAAQGLGAENLVGCVDLAVFYVAAVARGQEHHALFAHYAREVEEQVAGIVEVFTDDDHGGTGRARQGGKHDRSRRARHAGDNGSRTPHKGLESLFTPGSDE